MYDFVSGHLHSHPGLHVGRGLQVGHPWKDLGFSIQTLIVCMCSKGRLRFPLQI